MHKSAGFELGLSFSLVKDFKLEIEASGNTSTQHIFPITLQKKALISLEYQLLSKVFSILKSFKLHTCTQPIYSMLDR